MFKVVKKARHHDVDRDKQQQKISPGHATSWLDPLPKTPQISQENRDRATSMTKMCDDEAGEEQAKENVDKNRKVRQQCQQRHQDSQDQPEVNYPALTARQIVH